MRILRLPLVLASLCGLAALAGCSESTGPERPGLRLQKEPLLPDSTYGGELSRAGDTLAYSVAAPSDAPWRLELQARSGRAADTLLAELLDLTANRVLLQVSSRGDDPAPVYSERWLRPNPGGRYQVRLRGAGADDRGGYALHLRALSSRPESIEPRIALGDTVDGEAIDIEGDVDRFEFDAPAGEEVVVFLQSLRPQLLWLQLSDSAGNELRQVTSMGDAAGLEEASTGRLALPYTGRYQLRVAHGPFAAAGGGVRYRLRVQRVDPAPELGAAQLAVGQVSWSEALEPVGDVDEFRFTGAAGQEINLLVQLESGLSDGLKVELLRGATVLAQAQTSTPTTSLDGFGTGRVTLPAAGEYRLRFSGPPQGTRATATGSYRFELYPVSRLPEEGGVLRLDGPAVADCIGRPGDVDEFPFSGDAGQLVVLQITRPASDSAWLVVELVDAAGQPLRSVRTRQQLPGPEGYRDYSERLALPYGGSFRVRVSSSEWRPLATGAYRIEAYSVSAAPERVAAVLSVGQTVSDERIDRPGDLDVFTFEGEPGREVMLFLGAEPGLAGLPAHLSIGESYPPTVFAHAVASTLDTGGMGRLVLGATRYVLTIDSHPSAQEHAPAWQGSYGLRLFPVERQPEGRSGSYVVGDTVSGEPLYPTGDIDEYRFDLPTPARLQTFCELQDGAGYIRLWDEHTGRVVWGCGNTSDGQYTRVIDLPAGAYRIEVLDVRIEPYGDRTAYRPATLRYRFALTPE